MNSLPPGFPDSNPYDISYAEMIRIAAERATGPNWKEKHQRSCSKCGKPNTRSGQPWCDNCRKENRKKNYNPRRAHDKHLRRTYQISQEEYDLMLFQQGGVCAVCGQPETSYDKRCKKTRSLSVDHHHETGQVRQLLCQECNRLLGYIEKDRERVKKLVKYLKKHDT